MTDFPTTITTRWARIDDESLSFIAAGIPASVVEARIENRCIAVAEVAGRPVGALQLEYLWGTRPYIAMIRVLSDWQRRGVGRELLTFVESTLSLERHRELLSSSQANEPEPQEWHRHMGFTECGVLAGINENGIDEIFFRKPLASAGEAATIATAHPNERRG
jgi:ribosomal protein S18 acetylase RimI-like enzyme